MSAPERTSTRPLDTNKLLAWIGGVAGLATIASALADLPTWVLLVIAGALVLTLLALLGRRFVRWLRSLLDEPAGCRASRRRHQRESPAA